MHTNKVRSLYLDTMKGLLIILVVLGHSIQFTIADFQHNFLFRFIYSFHMPLFFLISGYLTYKKFVDKQLIKKRAIQLLIPFYTWAFLLPLFEHGGIDISAAIKVMLYPDNGLWFLYNLFVYCLLFNTSERWAKNRMRQEYICLIFVIICYMGMSIFHTKFNFSQICWYLPFFAFGYYYRKNESRISLNNTQITFLGLVYFILIPFWMMREVPLFYKWINLGDTLSYFYRYIVQILGSIFFFLISKRILNKKLPFINILGTKTLGIYAFQFVVLFHLNTFIQVQWTTIKIIIETILCLIICYILETLTHKIKYVRLFIIGEK